MKKLILFAVTSLLISTQAFAFSGQPEFACTVNGQLVAWITTQVRPFFAAHEEDVLVAQKRCEALGGVLGEQRRMPQPPAGAR